MASWQSLMSPRPGLNRRCVLATTSLRSPAALCSSTTRPTLSRSRKVLATWYSTSSTAQARNLLRRQKVAQPSGLAPVRFLNAPSKSAKRPRPATNKRKRAERTAPGEEGLEVRGEQVAADLLQTHDVGVDGGELASQLRPAVRPVQPVGGVGLVEVAGGLERVLAQHVVAAHLEQQLGPTRRPKELAASLCRLPTALQRRSWAGKSASWIVEK